MKERILIGDEEAIKKSEEQPNPAALKAKEMKLIKANLFKYI